MIRFIDIGEQILEGTDFAWYDTIRCEFITVDGARVWGTWKGFAASLRIDPPDNPEFTFKRFSSSKVREKNNWGVNIETEGALSIRFRGESIYTPLSLS